MHRHLPGAPPVPQRYPANTPHCLRSQRQSPVSRVAWPQGQPSWVRLLQWRWMVLRPRPLMGNTAPHPVDGLSDNTSFQSHLISKGLQTEDISFISWTFRTRVSHKKEPQMIPDVRG